MNNIITLWDNVLKTNSTTAIVEAAFMQIYIEFECFLRNTFIKFSLGDSYSTYVPNRKLAFSEEIQLSSIIKGESQFVDYLKAIERCSKHIFKKDPFEIINNSAELNDAMKKMQLIRHYLAHKSDEARSRYLNKVLQNYSISEFIEPGVFLLKKKNNSSITFYSYFCDKINDVVAIFNSDTLLQEYQ